MNKELIILASLIDQSVEGVFKEKVLEIPDKSFKSSKHRNIFNKLVNKGDVTDLPAEDLKLLADTVSDDAYKVFSGSPVENKLQTVESLLNEYRIDLVTAMVDKFSLDMYERKEPLKDLITRFSSDLTSLPSIDETVSIADACKKMLSDLRRTLDGKFVPVISTGFRNVDKALAGGFGAGDLIAIVAKSGHGKTTFFQNLLVQIIKKFPEKKILYLTSEMKPDQLSQRLSLIESSYLNRGLKFEDFRSPTEKFYDNVEQISQMLSNYKLDFQWCTNHKDIPFYMNRKEYDIVVLDHVHDLDGMHGKESESIASDVMNAMKEWAIAGDFRLAFCLNQPRKSSNDMANKELTADDIKGSQALQAKPSVILGIEKNENDCTSKVNILKNRYGLCEKLLQFRYDSRSFKFTEV